MPVRARRLMLSRLMKRILRRIDAVRALDFVTVTYAIEHD
jgi:hypothetical protein